MSDAVTTTTSTRRGRTRKSAWPAVAAVVAAIALAVVVLRPAPGPISAEMPPLDLPALGSERRITGATLEGKPIVLNLWASWCEPCRAEMPLLQEAHRRYEAEGLIVLGIDVEDVPLAAEELAAELGITYPLAEDLDASFYKSLRSAIGVRDGLPQTYFVTAAGSIPLSGPAAPVLGTLTESDLDDAIAELLERPS